MKKYICYDSNICVVLYKSNCREACEEFIEDLVKEYDDHSVEDLDERFAIYVLIRTMSVKWSEDDVE